MRFDLRKPILFPFLQSSKQDASDLIFTFGDFCFLLVPPISSRQLAPSFQVKKYYAIDPWIGRLEEFRQSVQVAIQWSPTVHIVQETGDIAPSAAIGRWRETWATAFGWCASSVGTFFHICPLEFEKKPG